LNVALEAAFFLRLIYGSAACHTRLATIPACQT
jgi:hypothetical protein